jgi:hypothetical protein
MLLLAGDRFGFVSFAERPLTLDFMLSSEDEKGSPREEMALALAQPSQLRALAEYFH